MAKGPRFNAVPFSEEQFAYLHWLQRPFRSNQTKQWVLPVTFRPDNGRPKQEKYPWGSLPALRIGQYYRNGRPQRYFYGKMFDVTVTSGPTVQTAARAVHRAHYELFTHANLNEPCFSFSTAEGYTLSVPILELVKACFAHNRVLAEGLLQPQFVRRFVHSSTVEGDELHLRLLPKARRHIRSRASILQIARLLSLPSFQSAWESVNHAIVTDQNPWTPELLPKLSPRWQVRGVSYRRSLLALEITDLSLAEALPFKRIRHGVQGQDLRPLELSKEDSDVLTNVPPKVDPVVSTDDRSTSRSKPVHRLSIASPALSTPNIKLVREKSETEPKELPLIINAVSDEKEQLGLTREERDGSLHPAEFENPSQEEEKDDSSNELEKLVIIQPEELAADARFAEFAGNIDALQAYAEEDILLMYSTMKITEERSISAVIAALTDSHPLIAYIIELESVLGGSASTLLIALERHRGVFIATDVFSKAVTPQGYWQLQALETAKAADSSIAEIFRLRHTSSGPERWAKRVVEKLKDASLNAKETVEVNSDNSTVVPISSERPE